MNTGPIALVTGGAAGIGEATVNTLVSAGIKCVVLDRAENPNRHNSNDVKFLECDVRDSNDVNAAVKEASNWSGNIEYLVNCAGVSRATPTDVLTESEWRDILAVNLDGVFFTSQAVGRLMISNGGGTIVNLGSVAGQFGWPHRLAYSCAKAAIEALTRTLAVEWAPHGVRVNTVVPSHVDTPLQRSLIAKGVVDPDAVVAMNVLHRMATADEIASAIYFLLSDSSSFITGQTINVDGGFNILKTAIPS